MRKYILSKFVSIIVLASMLMLTCERYPWQYYTLTFKNISENEIYVYPTFEAIDRTAYNDSLLPDLKPYLYLVNSGKNRNITSDHPWDEKLEAMSIDTFFVFFFHADTIEAYEWEIIRDNNKILDRREYSIPDLEELDYKIIYP